VGIGYEGVVAMQKKPRTYSQRLAHWSQKLTKEAGLWGVPAVGIWAGRLLHALHCRSDAAVEAPDMAGLASSLGIPPKFLSRALAATNGLVTLDVGPPLRLKLHRKRLLRSKNAVEKTRARISPSLRRQLLEKDGHRCGRCGKKFPADELEIDHFVPLALRGADEPGNWVALCRADHRLKWTRFRYDFIQYYRGRAVVSVGVRFRAQDGFFWPHIDGRTCTDRRSDWNA
jgi:hypothetical protein